MSHTEVHEPDTTARPLARPTTLLLVAALTALFLLWGLFGPDRTAGEGGMAGMSMTHYMELLGIRQPWNLLLFMAAPVVLAETLAITELVLLFHRTPPAWVRTLSHWAGLIAGPLMLGIAVHLLLRAVVPLTTDGGWRGWIDVIAVLSYLLSALPMIVITLVELGVIGRTDREARKWHASAIAAFLVIAHIAMIFGMLDPAVGGWGVSHTMPDGTSIPGHHH